MRVPTFEEFYDRTSTQELIQELEDAYELLDTHNGIRVCMTMQDFIEEYLEAEYSCEISSHMCDDYHAWKDDQ